MKKYFIYATVCLATILILIRCAKDNSNEEVKAKEEAASVSSTATGYADHLIPAGEARAMMSRYNELLGSLIENKFKEQNPNYVSPYVVIHDIDPMIEFLTHLKQKGYSKVNVRFAAIDGDGINGRIPGLPYHTVLFYGNKTNGTGINLRTTTDDEEVYDHGNLAPPPGPCGPSCPTNHTHTCEMSCTSTHTHTRG